MVNNFKKSAFTLAEILVTLVIVGVVALLVVPGLLRDISNKTKMSALQGAVASLNTALTSTLVKSRTPQVIDDTDVINHPADFLKTMSATNKANVFSGMTYTKFSGAGTYSVPSRTAEVLLKNGVAIALISARQANGDVIVAVDVNGQQEPNMVGVDYFELAIVGSNSASNGRHVGDVGSVINGGLDGQNLSKSSKIVIDAQTACKNGNPKACFYVAEATGFNPNYLTTTINEGKGW